MLEWTGKWFLPWIQDAIIAYEHLHRYVYARQFVNGKSVLDLAAGEGYGANLLAASARQVIGIDLDASAVGHASAKYRAANLQFIVGSITEIPAADESFDVVTCFEAVEHIQDQTDLLREVKRVLKPHGLFISSTPNKPEYQVDEANPYHVKELSPEEFDTLLRTQFRNVQFVGQRIHTQSSMWRLPPRPGDDRMHEFLIQRGAAEFEFAKDVDRVPIYVIGFASNAALPEVPNSALVDISDQLILQKDALIKDLLAGKDSDEKALQWVKGQLQEVQTAVQWQAGRIEDLQTTIDGLNRAIEWQNGVVENNQKTIESHERALEWRARQVQELENDKAALQHDLKSITNSAGWQWILRLCRLRDTLCPEGSRRQRYLMRLLKS